MGRRALVSAGVGAASSFAFAPDYLWSLLLVGVVVLVWLLDTRPGIARAALLGWAFGLGHFALGLQWVSVAFQFQSAMPAWLGGLGVLGLAAVLALYTGAATALAAALWSSTCARALVLAAAWTLAEWLRGSLFTGFPWNSAAQIWADTPAIAQFASLAGSSGLSLLTIAAFASVGVAMDGTRSARRLFLGLLAVAVVVVVYGTMRVPAANPASPALLRVHLVQADVAQDVKGNWQRQLEILERYEAMTANVLAERGPGLVVWPETATLYEVDHPATRERLAHLLPRDGRLVLGALRYQRVGGRIASARNSLVVLNARARIEAAYAKSRLVPFGEYLPARTWLERLGLHRLVPGNLVIMPGGGATTLSVPSLPAVSPLICYEIIFPGRVVDPDRRPAWLLNISNDAWFGDSSGPHQHLAQARLRAIEQGLPVVRSTPTGISAVIDPFGRIRGDLPIGEQGVLTGDVPVGLPPTLYARYGDTPALLVVLLLLAAGAAGQRVGRRAAEPAA